MSILRHALRIRGKFTDGARGRDDLRLGSASRPTIKEEAAGEILISGSHFVIKATGAESKIL
jgi:hypothetical protein